MEYQMSNFILKYFTRYLDENFPNEKETILNQAQIHFDKFMHEAPDMGKNMMASNIDLVAAFFAFYEALYRLPLVLEEKFFFINLGLTPLNAMQKIESLQILSFIYSIIIILYTYKITKKLNLNKNAQIATMMLVNFFPAFIYMSGFINNDQLITMFIVLSLYYLLEWSKKPNIKNTLILTIIFGLGMMTKTSMIVMMLPIGICVLLKLIKIQLSQLIQLELISFLSSYK